MYTAPAPYDLNVDSGGDQFTVTGPTPRLSWKVPVALAAHDGFELEASVGDSSLPLVLEAPGSHVLVAWPWRSLRSREQVRWRVRATHAEGPGAWSEWDSFEVGLLDADWRATWISPIEGEDPGSGRRPAVRLHVSFDVDQDVREARLYATALGVYEAFVNGERAGTAELSPGATSYDRTLYAQASDVTAALRAGENRIEIVLSDGWYRGQVGAFRMPAEWGSVLGARAELHLTLADGSHRVVVTDQSWTSSRSEISRADLMDGQTTDLTLVAGPDVPVLVDRVTAPAIEWSPAPPVRVVETRPAASVTRLSDETVVIDFGQNASGWVVLRDLGPAGTRTVIDYGEYVDASGDLSTSHLDSGRPGQQPLPFVQHDEVVSDGGDGVFEPTHTIHGFQYARIRREGAPLDASSVEMRVVQSDLRRAGTFESSSDDLNRLHQIADWSFRGNAVDVPTDCPTRERLAWTGDYQVFAPTATRLYDVLGFTRKWLQSVRDDQLPDGRIANFSPDGRRIKHHLDDQLAMMTGSSGWGDAIVAVPWEMYESYGDREVLAENWQAMTRWVDWALESARTTRHPSRVARSAEPQPHEQYVWDGSFHWGEWTEPRKKRADGSRIDPVVDNPAQWFMADKGEVGTAYLYRSTSTVARIARILGDQDAAQRYESLADRILDAWRAEFLHDDGTTVGDTQAAYVRALSFGLIPGPLRPAAADRLVELIRDADDHLATGFLSTGDLLPVLADTGHADVAHALLFQRSAPSWLYMVDRGATTIWEDWEGIDDQGVAHDSLNHYSKGAVIRFLHTHTLGLRQEPSSVAWRAFVVAPTPAPGMTWARGSYESPQGTISVAWHLDGEELRIAVDVPAGATATIVFPDGTVDTATAGSYEGTRPLESLAAASSS